MWQTVLDDAPPLEFWLLHQLAIQLGRPHLQLGTVAVLAPERVTEKALVRFDKPAAWSFQGTDTHILSQVCKDSRDVVQKHCVTFRGKDDTPITTKGPIVYANINATMYPPLRPRDRSSTPGCWRCGETASA
ncbi:unnamed protein product [Clonostachys byssicola]|uniref:Uncharacterized protein n=1 Tax=Clonostachys byssicola TaxID=160290 RepID=A0A9N9U583_9HYPO|nr:unnamed protein product [Clonostachys byssicola]